MKISIQNIDEIELRKRYKYFKNIENFIRLNPYVDAKEKEAELITEFKQFRRSLNKEESLFLNNLFLEKEMGLNI